jgi:hypothetical protein
MLIISFKLCPDKTSKNKLVMDSSAAKVMCGSIERGGIALKERNKRRKIKIKFEHCHTSLGLADLSKTLFLEKQE